MSKEGRELVKEAIEDGKALKGAALDAAKRQIVEALTPELKLVVEKALRGTQESVDRSGDQGSQQFPQATRKKHAKFEEGDQNMNKDDMEESLAGFFPQLSEEEEEMDEAGAMGAGAPMMGKPPAGGKPMAGGEEEEEQDEAMIPTLGEGEDEDAEAAPELVMPSRKKHKAEPEADDMEEGKKRKDDEEMDEDVEISESELKKVYQEALQMEVQVKKGFGEQSKAGELDEVDPGAGLMDVKKGEHGWEEELPPAKQDYTVKEMIQRGLAENKSLREANKKLAGAIKEMADKLHEVNLFNSKVLHVNRILNKHGRLTTEQKKVVLESIDRAQSIAEVRTVYETIVGAFRATSSKGLAEGKRPPRADAQRARTSGAPDPKVIRESVDRSEDGAKYARLKMLAGLTK